jgi:acyl-CoA synthetase (AMP-forming)/AMP-acid ligase II
VSSLADDHGLVAATGGRAIPGDGPHSVAEVLDRFVARDPTREALVGRSGRFSYAELDVAVGCATRALAGMGVGAGTRVAACLPNDVEMVIAFLATQRLSAIWVGVNRALAVPEKAYVLADSGAELLFATPDVARSVAGADGSALRHLVEVDPGNRDAVSGWDAFLAAAPDAIPALPPVDSLAPAAIAYTSGTTGIPKGAVHSQHNLLLPGAVSVATGRYEAGLRMGVVLPLTILNLVVLGPLTAFQAGYCCVAIDRIDPVGLADWIRRERVGTFAGVPTIFHDLLTHPDVNPESLVSLVCPEVGGAECPEEFRALYLERFGAPVRVGYGMTEAPTAVTWSDGESAPRPGLCGKALPQIEISIRDAAGARLPAGEVGEICIAPANRGEWADVYTPMLGYWNQPEATAEALRDGAYHSGDLGVLESDGSLFIRGRRSELILRGGANVYPAEVERVLLADPRVAGCAVFGVPDPRLGQRVVAAVEGAEGESPDPGVLLERCNAQLARYKVPEQILVVDALPRNAMAKVIKRELEAFFAGDSARGG